MKWSVTLTGRLGPKILTVLEIKGQVLHRVRLHVKVPGWLLKLNALLTKKLPIVSACSCPTERISSYLDKVMTPIVKSLPSYIKDSNHALEIFRNFNFSGENKIIFTMDITSLNIHSMANFDDK